MKLKHIMAAGIAIVLFSCSSGDTTEQHKDSANTLQDTFPANNGLRDSVGVDSNPADNTHVDSLQMINQ